MLLADPTTLHHDLALFRLLPCYSAIPTTLPITCLCRCGCYYYRVRCRLIFRSRALSVVYGTALAPASTSFFLSFLSSPFSFFFTSFPLDACRTLSSPSTFAPFVHTQSPSILPPKYDTDHKLFLFYLFFPVRSTISTLSLFLLQYTHYYTRAFSPATTKEKKCTTHL